MTKAISWGRSQGGYILDHDGVWEIVPDHHGAGYRVLRGGIEVGRHLRHRSQQEAKMFAEAVLDRSRDDN
jgi:hypothetical protein